MGWKYGVEVWGGVVDEVFALCLDKQPQQWPEDVKRGESSLWLVSRRVQGISRLRKD